MPRFLLAIIVCLFRTMQNFDFVYILSKNNMI